MVIDGRHRVLEEQRLVKRALKTHLLRLRLVDRAQRRGGLGEPAHAAGA
jgi:hypothetical protein